MNWFDQVSQLVIVAEAGAYQGVCHLFFLSSAREPHRKSMAEAGPRDQEALYCRGRRNGEAK